MTFKEVKNKIKYDYRLSVSEEIFDKVLVDIGCPNADSDNIDIWFESVDTYMRNLAWEEGMSSASQDWEIIKALNPEVTLDSYFDSYEVNEIDYDGEYDAIVIRLV